ncbi:hypothetical protein FHW69_002343 [Luteibacter sp. Sphag1AF]|uniref:hypothetical protein n=1 Tax=Luteibacter sp. Sphag1AF TaxID=2587031 RepID=UPI00161DF761|nr:hypothetical protein [Luteibacter sp. Sphag1AF]MBB3227720.1 hypothetical protein [Luteibacter sp. Sphag1AF]
MNSKDTPAREYTRPPMTRGVDPQRMNWLWQLVLQSTHLDPRRVCEALNAVGVPVTEARVESWSAPDRADNYFPLTIAELERNLRAVVALEVAEARRAGQADADS